MADVRRRAAGDRDSNSRGRGTGAGTNPAPRGEPALTPRGLVRLQDQAGNAAVSRLVAGTQPVVQRVSLTVVDEREIATLEGVNARAAEEARRRIGTFGEDEGAIWRDLTLRPRQGVEDTAWRNYINELYLRLGKDRASLTVLQGLRADHQLRWQPGEQRPLIRQGPPTLMKPNYGVTPQQLGGLRLRPTGGFPGSEPQVESKPPDRPPPLPPRTTNTVPDTSRNQIPTTTTAIIRRQLPPPPLNWGGFSPADQAFLQAVWTGYRTGVIKNWEDVADRFRTSETKQGQPPSQGSAETFVQDVNRLGLRPGGPHTDPKAIDKRIKESASGYPVDTQAGAQTGSIQFRIYLNVTVRDTPAVYHFVRDTIDAPRRVTTEQPSGVVFSKMASHEIARASRDVIVVYTTDETANGQVLDELRRYQSDPLNKARFEDEIVRMTEPAQGLRGVGVGADPPTYNELKTLGREYAKKKPTQWREAHGEVPLDVNLSFSQYRSVLIFAAMEKALSSSNDPRQQDSAYVATLVANFRDAGLDPSHPGRQAPVTDRVVGALENLFF